MGFLNREQRRAALKKQARERAYPRRVRFEKRGRASSKARGNN